MYDIKGSSIESRIAEKQSVDVVLGSDFLG